MAKQHDDFPLYLHATGQWAKRINRKVYYFGKDATTALNRYLAEKDYLLAGKPPPEAGVTLDYLVQHFLFAKKQAMDEGSITSRTYKSYKEACEWLLVSMDRHRTIASMRPDDFQKLRRKLSQGRGPVSLKGFIVRLRVLFKHAVDQEFVPRIRYGSSFKQPPAKLIRRAKNEKGTMMFRPIVIRRLIKRAHWRMRAMIWLGINCGFGNNDCALIPIDAIDWKNGWHNFARPKTEIERRCPLWPETLKALKRVLKHRMKQTCKETDPLFLTKYGNSFASDDDRPISKEFRKLCKSCDSYRRGIGFYALRHTFQTVGEVAGETATEYIMGHAAEPDDMSANYRAMITDDRLVAVTNYVRSWLLTRPGELVVGHPGKHGELTAADDGSRRP